ncbi:MAG: hypothetical protein KC438_07510, partial [Thermomicrobiales bacterium]|nr:hypothetical protein [Thermomicrobiales bacterium]
MSIVRTTTNGQSPGHAGVPPGMLATEVVKRDGRSVPADPMRIVTAIEMAFRAEIGAPYPDPLPTAIHERTEAIATEVVQALNQDHGASAIDVETIQDEVERQLMAAGAFGIAKRYIIYRQARTQQRHERTIAVVDDTGEPLLLHPALLCSWVDEVCAGFEETVSAKDLLDEVMVGIYPGIRLSEVEQLITYGARGKIEVDPVWSFVASRSLLRRLYAEVAGQRIAIADAPGRYPTLFTSYIRGAVAQELLDERLLAFDLDRLGAALEPERDLVFAYLGLQTLYDRYLIRSADQRLELPQAFWMRVAMGLALNEDDRDARAIEFYQLLSSFRFCSSTPTLFNSGTRHPQLSSCYLTTIGDDLDQIFSALKDNALLSKWSGGLGNDWTRVRALGSRIKGTNGLSQGIVPFL